MRRSPLAFFGSAPPPSAFAKFLACTRRIRSLYTFHELSSNDRKSEPGFKPGAAAILALSNMKLFWQSSSSYCLEGV